MKPSVRSLGVVLLIAAAVGSSWWALRGHAPQDLEIVEVENPVIVQDEDWVSFSHPAELTESALDLEFELLEQVDEIFVRWSHAALPEGEEFQLQKFVPQSRKALYRINAAFGNLVPGNNSYVVTARQITSDGDLEKVREFQTSFELQFDLLQLSEFQPEKIQLVGLPETTDTNELDIVGKLSVPADQMRAFSFHPKTGVGTFSVLNRFEPGAVDFDYFAKESYDNLQSGENIYVFESYDADDQLLSRAQFSLNSSRLTLAEEVQKQFGSFEKVRGGWYQSSLLPWFVFRPVYDDVVYQPEEGMVVFARPTLLYTAESYKDVKFCDYLSETDYSSEEVIYRGYSYETCQDYSRGVTVYDRAVSALTWEAAMTIPVDEYQEVAEKTTSAFVMIETVGMENKPSSISSDVLTEGAAFSEGDEDSQDDEEEKTPIFFVVQMLITEQADYDEDLIGDIKTELSDEQAAVFQEIREMLSAHPAELLFGPFLKDSK